MCVFLYSVPFMPVSRWLFPLPEHEEYLRLFSWQYSTAMFCRSFITSAFVDKTWNSFVCRFVSSTILWILVSSPSRERYLTSFLSFVCFLIGARRAGRSGDRDNQELPHEGLSTRILPAVAGRVIVVTDRVHCACHVLASGAAPYSPPPSDTFCLEKQQPVILTLPDLAHVSSKNVRIY